MITIAITKSGDIVSIHTAKRGKSDSLFCPCCKTLVTSKQGLMNAWHFAHVQKECKYSRLGGGESELHLTAKHLIAKRGEILLPKETLIYGNYRNVFGDNFQYPIGIETRFDFYKVESAKTEFRKNGYIPDVICVIGGREIAIEICVTNAVKDSKAAKFRRDNLPCIEITIPKFRNISDLEMMLFGSRYCYRWVFNRKLDAMIYWLHQWKDYIFHLKKWESSMFLTPKIYQKNG